MAGTSRYSAPLLRSSSSWAIAVALESGIVARVASVFVLREVPGVAHTEVEQLVVALADHDDGGFLDGSSARATPRSFPRSAAVAQVLGGAERLSPTSI